MARESTLPHTKRGEPAARISLLEPALTRHSLGYAALPGRGGRAANLEKQVCTTRFLTSEAAMYMKKQDSGCKTNSKRTVTAVSSRTIEAAGDAACWGGVGRTTAFVVRAGAFTSPCGSGKRGDLLTPFHKHKNPGTNSTIYCK